MCSKISEAVKAISQGDEIEIPVDVLDGKIKVVTGTKQHTVSILGIDLSEENLSDGKQYILTGIVQKTMTGSNKGKHYIFFDSVTEITESDVENLDQIKGIDIHNEMPTDTITALDEVTQDMDRVTIEVWVNRISIKWDKLRQKVWVGDKTASDFTVVFYQSYPGKLVETDNKYRFQNVRPNFFSKSKTYEPNELQLIVDQESQIEHIVQKKGANKPRWYKKR